MRSAWAGPLMALSMALVMAPVLPLVVGGCTINTVGTLPGERRVRPGDPGGAFAPALLRVFPLTRFVGPSAADQEPALVVHVEMIDAWGDATKGVGELRLVVQPDGASAGVEPVTWDIDLNDLTLNATLYDPPTRTYRIRLIGLPAWLVDAAAAGRAVKVAAVLNVRDGDGVLIPLRDTLVLAGEGEAVR